MAFRIAITWSVVALTAFASSGGPIPATPADPPRSNPVPANERPSLPALVEELRVSQSRYVQIAFVANVVEPLWGRPELERPETRYRLEYDFHNGKIAERVTIESSPLPHLPPGQVFEFRFDGETTVSADRKPGDHRYQAVRTLGLEPGAPHRFSSEGNPFRGFWPGPVAMGEVEQLWETNDALARVEAGEPWQGLPTVRLRVTYKTGTSHFCIDFLPSHDYYPVRQLRFNGPIGEESLVTLIQAEGLAEFAPEQWFPTRLKQTWPGGDAANNVQMTIHVERVALSRVDGPPKFDGVPVPSIVEDRTSGTRYTVSSTGERANESVIEPAENFDALDP